jgi:hypothetical protein
MARTGTNDASVPIMAENWETYFQPGETLLWQGAPKPGVQGWGKIIGLAIFGLPFLIIGLGAFVAGLSQILDSETWSDTGLGLFFTAFSIPFAGIGAVMVFGQWYGAATAHRTIRYALSTRAAYVAKSGWKPGLECYPILPSSATGLEKGRTSDTVWVHVQNAKDSDGDRSTTRIGFDNIADGDSVYRLIRGIQTGTP